MAQRPIFAGNRQTGAWMKTGVAIVGGGLAGLSLARRLHLAGRDFQLFEARDRLGGRIAALRTDQGAVDLGPSWFWPGQPRMAALTAELGLRVFPQFAQGDVCLEDATGRVFRGAGYASMEGSFRVAGGMVAVVDALAATLPAKRLHLCARVEGLSRSGSVMMADGGSWQADHVVLALPPRIAADLAVDPPLDPGMRATLAAIPTWMAGQAKFVAVYDRPFCRELGLSGDAMSHRGPLMEIHDASGPEGTPAALFGFLGIPAPDRAGRADEIAREALVQLARLFGPAAQTPNSTALQDWAFQRETATEIDLRPPSKHPDYCLPPRLSGLWDGRLHFAATETAPEMGGYLEGALAAAEMASMQLQGCGLAT